MEQMGKMQKGRLMKNVQVCRSLWKGRRFTVLNVAVLAISTVLWGATSADSNNTLAAPESIRLPAKNTLLSNVTFVVFDTETTGFSPKNDRMVELGAIKFRNGKVLDSKTWLINPRRSIPFYVQKVHGITPEMVKEAPTFKQVYPEFEDFIKGCVLLAHNAPFDLGFMRAEILRSGHTLPPNLTIDSLRLFRHWYPEQKSYKLGDLAEAMEVTGGTFHRAEADSLYVFLILDKELKKRDAKLKLDDLYSDAGGAMRF